MADLTDSDRQSIEELAACVGFLGAIGRVLLHLLDHEGEDAPAHETPFICPTEGCALIVGHDRGHAKFGEPIPPAPEPAVPADHQTTWVIPETDGPPTPNAFTAANALVEAACARADAAERRVAWLEAGIRSHANVDAAFGANASAADLRALLAGPEGTEQSPDA